MTSTAQWPERSTSWVTAGPCSSSASCSYGPVATREFQDGLPGVATNLLADRLRHLEESGVVTRDEQGRYELTARGKDSPPRARVCSLGRSADDGEAKWRFLSEPLAGDSVGLNVRRIRPEPT